MINALALNQSLLTPESVQLLTRSIMTSTGIFCEKSEDLNFLAHLNTPSNARDLDLIRQLEGYETIDYWGFSYGTVLGTMYAAMFPDRVGRMVLDGNSLALNNAYLKERWISLTGWALVL
jgi:pimeloyl-ACP methyl ester carboxylesterase